MASYNASIQAVAMPPRIAQLKVSPTGFPVPWFVAWFDGVPDFRVVDRGKRETAVARRLCWVCGQPMGRFMAMTLGPMCTITRTISEPPAHRECAIFSAIACPFLANPRMRRRETGLPEERTEAPGMIKRNPGAVAVWVTLHSEPFAHEGGTLFTFGDPTEVLWFAEGRAATRDEVMASIESGLPLLLDMDLASNGDARQSDLSSLMAQALPYLPAAAEAR